MGKPATPAYWATNPAWGRADDVNRVILPTVTFRDRMSVYYGDTQVDFLWPGKCPHLRRRTGALAAGAHPVHGRHRVLRRDAAECLRLHRRLDQGVRRRAAGSRRGHHRAGTRPGGHEDRSQGHARIPGAAAAGRAPQLRRGHQPWARRRHTGSGQVRELDRSGPRRQQHGADLLEFKGTIGLDVDRELYSARPLAEYNELKRRP